MKKTPAFFFVLFPFFLFAQDVYISDPIPVAESTFGNRAPRIALLDDGTPVVYWGKSGAAAHLYIARLEGASFSPPVLVPTGDLDVSLWNDALGPQIACSGDHVFLVYEAHGEGIFCSTSTDGGLNFSSPVSAVDLPSGRIATLPCITATESGNPILGFITATPQESQALYEVVSSTDGGQSFGPTTVASEPADGEEVCECCPGDLITRGDEEVFLSFRNNDNNLRDIWVSASTNGAQSFDQATDVDNSDWVLNACPGSGPQSVFSGDSLYTTFFSGGSGSARVYLSSMHPGTMENGYQWTLPHYPGGSGTQNFPRIAGQNDTLGVIWQESISGSTDIMLGISTTGGAGVATNTFQLAGGALAQKNPDIAYENGLFHMVYIDQTTNQVMYQQVGFSPFSSSEDIPALSSSLNAYPNPFHSSFTLELPITEGETAWVRIWDQTGLLIRSFTTQESQHTLSQKEMPSGIYMVECQNGTARSFIKVVAR